MDEFVSGRVCAICTSSIGLGIVVQAVSGMDIFRNDLVFCAIHQLHNVSCYL